MRTKYLKPHYFIDSDHPLVKAYAKEHASQACDDIQKAVKLYYAVRDGFQYNPYFLDFKKEALKASYLLQRKEGYCVEKAVMFTAVCRAAGLPARLGFAIVKNHIGTERLERFLKTDLLVFHGYTEVFLNEKWVKATPAFNKALCDRLGVPPLDFNGHEDSVLQEYDRKGARYMEYVHIYGSYADLPYEQFISELQKYYGDLFESKYYNASEKQISFTD